MQANGAETTESGGNRLYRTSEELFRDYHGGDSVRELNAEVGRERLHSENNYGVNEVHQDVKTLQSKYKGTNVVAVTSSITAEELIRLTSMGRNGYTLEDIEAKLRHVREKKITGITIESSGEIIIFADNIANSEVLESTIFHENVHSYFIKKFGDGDNHEIFDAYWNWALKHQPKAVAAIKDAYPSEQWKSELFAMAMEYCMNTGRLNVIDKGVGTEGLAIVNDILDFIGYERETEREARLEGWSDSRVPREYASNYGGVRYATTRGGTVDRSVTSGGKSESGINTSISSETGGGKLFREGRWRAGDVLRVEGGSWKRTPHPDKRLTLLTGAGGNIGLGQLRGKPITRVAGGSRGSFIESSTKILKRELLSLYQIIDNLAHAQQGRVIRLLYSPQSGCLTTRIEDADHCGVVTCTPVET